MDVDLSEEAVARAKCLITCFMRGDVDTALELIREQPVDLYLVVALSTLASSLVKGFAIANDEDPDELWASCLFNIARLECT